MLRRAVVGPLGSAVVVGFRPRRHLGLRWSHEARGIPSLLAVEKAQSALADGILRHTLVVQAAVAVALAVVLAVVSPDDVPLMVSSFVTALISQKSVWLLRWHYSLRWLCKHWRHVQRHILPL